MRGAGLVIRKLHVSDPLRDLYTTGHPVNSTAFCQRLYLAEPRCRCPVQLWQRRTVRAAVRPVLFIRKTGLGLGLITVTRAAAKYHKKNNQRDNSEFHKGSSLSR